MITICLATYNGEKYLHEQIDSLLNQSYQEFKILAIDDCSIDSTVEILHSYGIETIVSPKNLGVKKSFSKLLEYALKNRGSTYFMFCDQDDIWKEDKIEKSVKKMQELEKNFVKQSLLIHTDLEIVNEDLKTLDKSMWHYEHLNPKLNSFNRLLIQNTITGCTVMINRQLATKVLSIPDNAIMHDSWIGLVASRFGKIDSVNEATIKYRQHEKNSIGARGFGLQYFKNKLLNNNILEKNILQAEAFLDKYIDSLDQDTIKMLESFARIKSKSFLEKRKTLVKYQLLKQGFLRNIGLLLKI